MCKKLHYDDLQNFADICCKIAYNHKWGNKIKKTYVIVDKELSDDTIYDIVYESLTNFMKKTYPYYAHQRVKKFENVYGMKAYFQVNMYDEECEIKIANSTITVAM